jgi:hypothetical protein
VNFIDPGTYYKIVYEILNRNTGKILKSGTGEYFKTEDEALRALETVKIKHPDAKIIKKVVGG